MNNEIKNKEKSSVLVIGGGFAGMYAALSASKEGSSVRILCKGRVGNSGNSTIAMSVHRFAPDSPGLREEYRANFRKSGAGVPDTETGDYFVDHAAEAMEKLRTYAFPLYFRCREEDGKEYPYLACCDPKKGIILTRAIRKYIDENTSIQVEENTAAIEIIHINGTVCGVLALRDNTILYYPADAVILAAGGGGHIFADTNNTADITGDGYALAVRAGLCLRDMEFIQFYPYRIVSPGVADIFPDIFEHGAVYRNDRGERFMDQPQYPRKELENRDVVARAMHFEQEVWLDLSGCDMDYLQRECPNIYEMYRNHPDKPLTVRPMAHFFMGGVPLKTDCSTEIKGLYACGEVTGGLHGANRLAGSALTECVVFGQIAGAEASRWAQENTAPEAFDAAEETARTYPLVGTDDLRPLRKRLGEVMAENVSLIRSEQGLRIAANELSLIREDFLKLRPSVLKDWFELRSMIITAEQVVSAAQKRKDSIGSHFRIN